MPYERYIQQHVFDTAGMKTAGFFGYGDADVAPGYLRASPGAPWTPAIECTAATGAAPAAPTRGGRSDGVRQRAAHARLLDAPMTAWFFENPADGARARAAIPTACRWCARRQRVARVNGAWPIVTLGNWIRRMRCASARRCQARSTTAEERRRSGLTRQRREAHIVVVSFPRGGCYRVATGQVHGLAEFRRT